MDTVSSVSSRNDWSRVLDKDRWKSKLFEFEIISYKYVK